jgi:hypothetical protein
VIDIGKIVAGFRSVHVSSHWYFDVDFLMRMLACIECPQHPIAIEELILTDNEEMTYISMKNIQNGLRSLKSLTVINCGNLLSGGMVRMASMRRLCMDDKFGPRVITNFELSENLEVLVSGGRRHIHWSASLTASR